MMASDAKRLRMRTLRQAGPTPDIGGSAPARRLRCKRCACNKAGVYLTSSVSRFDFSPSRGRPLPRSCNYSTAHCAASMTTFAPRLSRKRGESSRRRGEPSRACRLQQPLTWAKCSSTSSEEKTERSRRRSRLLRAARAATTWRSSAERMGVFPALPSSRAND